MRRLHVCGCRCPAGVRTLRWGAVRANGRAGVRALQRGAVRSRRCRPGDLQLGNDVPRAGIRCTGCAHRCVHAGPDRHRRLAPGAFGGSEHRTADCGGRPAGEPYGAGRTPSGRICGDARGPLLSSAPLGLGPSGGHRSRGAGRSSDSGGRCRCGAAWASRGPNADSGRAGPPAPRRPHSLLGRGPVVRHCAVWRRKVAGGSADVQRATAPEEWAHLEYFLTMVEGARTRAIVVAPPGASTDRAVEILQAIRADGGGAIAVTHPRQDPRRHAAAASLTVDGDIWEGYTPLPYAVPVQLLSIAVALYHGQAIVPLNRGDGGRLIRESAARDLPQA